MLLILDLILNKTLKLSKYNDLYAQQQDNSKWFNVA